MPGTVGNARGSVSPTTTLSGDTEVTITWDYTPGDPAVQNEQVDISIELSDGSTKTATTAASNGITGYVITFAGDVTGETVSLLNVTIK